MKKALVTGSSSGLGAALASELINGGYEVVGVDRQAPESKGLSLSIICDLSDRDDVTRTASAIVASGPFDLVFMNAGISATGHFEVIPVEAQLALLRVNLEAPIVLTNALLKSDALSGPVCFVSSLSHFTGYPGAATYAASKDGLVAYTRSLRKAGIKTMVAFPGPLDTPHAARHAPQGSSADKRMKPDIAAKAIINAAISGKKTVLPGALAKLSSIAGRLLPNSVTKIMRKSLYEKLDRTIW
ncbi:MAG: SDR family NAD(P)-dependent oxidoreductase [Rhizobiaceae bacterium]